MFAEPEVVTKQLTANHPFLVLASDGVWEFLPSQSVVDMVGLGFRVSTVGQPCSHACGVLWVSRTHGFAGSKAACWTCGTPTVQKGACKDGRRGGSSMAGAASSAAAAWFLPS